MFFLFWITYRKNLSGSTGVAVRCEHCDSKYYYKLTRTARGQGLAPFALGTGAARDDAHRKAADLLCRTLEEHIDAVPCPSCGSYQGDMVQMLRQQHAGWAQRYGVAGVACGVLFSLFVGAFYSDQSKGGWRDVPVEVCYGAWAALALIVVLSAGLLLWRWKKNASYDPNDSETLQERLELARSLVITKEQALYWREQAEQLWEQAEGLWGQAS